ncbi:hypothetical protein SO802_030012 [Lithocarpus litseifolius]|uniref:NAC domain-containing protein n=1 Tax=Lithocarpus litseifolius TaxID=425828 RepID=A0AAW2BWF0_9ROSI
MISCWGKQMTRGMKKVHVPQRKDIKQSKVAMVSYRHSGWVGDDLAFGLSGFRLEWVSDLGLIAHFENRVSKLCFVAMFSSPKNSGDFDNSPPPPPPYATSSFYHDEEKEHADQEEYASSSFYQDEDKEADQEEEENPEEQYCLAGFLDDLLMELQDDEDEEDEDEEPAHKQQNCNFGYKFHPTDYDLIVHYLIKKILNQPLPCNRVVDDEDKLLYQNNSNYGETAWYFFTRTTQQYRKGKRPILASGNGYWKAMGDDKEINSKEIVVGYKKKFVFHRGNPLSGDKTNWIMKEYRITHPSMERNPRIKNGERISRFILLF